LRSGGSQSQERSQSDPAAEPTGDHRGAGTRHGETMSKLRVDPLPKAVHWPYVGQAFPLLEKFYAYPHNERPPESLQRQIQQVPGLKKCIVSV
jgi:hypothetical protein